MPIIKNVSIAMRKYKELTQMSISEMSEELGIPPSSVQCYLKGSSDLRATTIELLADKMKVPLTEMVSGPTPGWERAETIVRATKELSGLSEENREQAIRLFLQLVALFSQDV